MKKMLEYYCSISTKQAPFGIFQHEKESIFIQDEAGGGFVSFCLLTFFLVGFISYSAISKLNGQLENRMKKTKKESQCSLSSIGLSIDDLFLGFVPLFIVIIAFSRLLDMLFVFAT